MPAGYLAHAALPFLAQALNLMPIGIGVGNGRGDYLTVIGGLAGLVGKRHIHRDPRRMARWSVFDDAGAELPLKDWPSQRALRGETALPGVCATYVDADGLERHFRMGAAPIDLPGKERGFVFLLQDASDERLTRTRVQEQLATVLSDTIERFHGPAPSAASETAPVRAALLTNREQDVLRLFALGHSRKEIARRLGIAVKTVDFYQAAGMRKARLRNRIDVVQFAIAAGWMRPDSGSDGCEPEIFARRA